MPLYFWGKRSDILVEQTREPLTESWFYILLCLYNGPNHGYGIMQQTAKITGGRVNIGAGTMYGACTSLVKKGYIKESLTTAGNRKKNYELTQSGINRLLEERNRLELLVADAETIIGADDGGIGGQQDD